VEIARAAYRDFGKGSGHPAGLNFGDCFAYALARARREPLLTKGDDFSQTDVAVARRSRSAVVTTSVIVSPVSFASRSASAWASGFLMLRDISTSSRLYFHLNQERRFRHAAKDRRRSDWAQISISRPISTT
jgi:hypothetical protein